MHVQSTRSLPNSVGCSRVRVYRCGRIDIRFLGRHKQASSGGDGATGDLCYAIGMALYRTLFTNFLKAIYIVY